MQAGEQRLLRRILLQPLAPGLHGQAPGGRGQVGAQIGLTGRELFHAVYSDPSIGFIAEQVAKFSGDWANFSKGSAKS